MLVGGGGVYYVCTVQCRIQLDPDADVNFLCPVLGLRHDRVGKHLQVKPTKLTRISKGTQRQRVLLGA